MACLTALVQPLSGDRSAKHLAAAQPLKLAAAEAHFHTGARAPLRMGGLPDLETGEFHGALPIPGGLSFLAFGDFDATVNGLDAFPRDEWPPVLRVRTAFQVMVGAGSAMALAALADHRRGDTPAAAARLAPLAVGVRGAGPARLRRLEAGWLVTEWGRQPWIVRGLMRTADAVTPFPQGGGVLAVHARLPLPGRRRGLPAGPADPGADKPANRPGRRMSPELLLAGGIGVALVLYFLFGGADFGGGVWDLLATGPRAAAQRGAIEHGDRPGLGGEPRLADPGGRHPVHRLPAGLRRDLDRPARAADAVPDRRRAARLGVRLPRARHVGPPRQQRYGLVFSIASMIAPVLLGMIVGALVSGDIRVQGGIVASGFFAPWLAPFPLAVGLFALALCALLAATYLTVEAPTRRCARTSAGARWRRRSPSA